jgi:catalase
VKERVVEYWSQVDPDLRTLVAESLGIGAVAAPK